MSHQPIIRDVPGRREFPAFAAAVLAFIINQNEEVLLLAHPKRGGQWEVVNGKLEAGETLLQGALREVAEEAGPAVKVRPLGLAHAYTFHYDDNLSHMLSIGYVMAYLGGEIVPGDDMQRSRWRWWPLAELMADEVPVIVPGRKWIFRRAIELYRLWKDQEVDLVAEESLPIIGSKHDIRPPTGESD
jgi:ADP-ribose pyrophosphatase YjhB (NUDIX family)